MLHGRSITKYLSYYCSDWGTVIATNEDIRQQELAEAREQKLLFFLSDAPGTLYNHEQAKRILRRFLDKFNKIPGTLGFIKVSFCLDEGSLLGFAVSLICVHCILFLLGFEDCDARTEETTLVTEMDHSSPCAYREWRRIFVCCGVFSFACGAFAPSQQSSLLLLL